MAFVQYRQNEVVNNRQPTQIVNAASSNSATLSTVEFDDQERFYYNCNYTKLSEIDARFCI